jgi:hypothetical protein
MIHENEIELMCIEWAVSIKVDGKESVNYSDKVRIIDSLSDELYNHAFKLIKMQIDDASKDYLSKTKIPSP